ncbi:MAG: LysE family transporter [Pseudomonadota bacterium]
MLDWLPNPLILPVGLVIGILIAAPVGPVNVLCIQRAIERGPFGGLPAGFGAVCADGLIALGAALGVGAITGLVTHYRDAIQIIGGIALLAFAVLLFRKQPQIHVAQGDAFNRDSLMRIAWDAPKAFLLTVTNPAAVLGLVAIFGGVSSFVEVRGKIDALTLVASIMVGSAIWWVGLSAAVGRLRGAIKTSWLARINWIAALVLIAFAVLLIGEVALKYATGIRLG